MELLNIPKVRTLLELLPDRIGRKWHLWFISTFTLTCAPSLGFTKVVSIDMVRESFPLLDMVDHNRRPKVPVSDLTLFCVFIQIDCLLENEI